MNMSSALITLGRNPSGVDVAKRTRGSTNWVDTNPRGLLRGAQAHDKWAKRIGPTGIVGQSIG